MAKQVINTGAAANDGTGDPLRSAFTKSNDNFTELYDHLTNINNPHQTDKVKIGLANVIDALQVQNAGGFVSLQADVIASRPAAANAGRFFYATDTDQLFRDTGTAWVKLLTGNAVNKDVNYTATGSDFYIGITTLPHTLTLPGSATVKDAFQLVVKDEVGGAAANNITINPNGTDTIDGAAGLTINTNFGSVTLLKRATKWNIISQL